MSSGSRSKSCFVGRETLYYTPTRDHGKKNDDALSDEEKTPYMRMFTYIDENNAHSVSKSQFEAFLRSFGLDDEVGRTGQIVARRI